MGTASAQRSLPAGCGSEERQAGLEARGPWGQPPRSAARTAGLQARLHEQAEGVRAFKLFLLMS